MRSDEPTAPLDRADGPGPSGLPGLAEGTELAGEFVGAGYRVPPLLVYRRDGQVVRLPELLYQAVRALDECQRLGDPAAARRPFTDRGRLLEGVAGLLSAHTGRGYAAEHVEFLLDQKLAPLGVTTYSDGSEPELVKPQPMLSLTCRMTMFSERSTWFLAGLFTWLFTKPALAVMIPLILGATSWALITQPIAGAIELTLASPGSILLVVALAIASTGFHEIGHGTACRYGGVRPGVTGCGFYLAWPVFFTDITNTYRMGRGGRLRADFGGVYFNGVFLLGLIALYWATGRTPFLLAAILSTSLEAVQQLLPTLRFDGYYIIADLVGIPDLFKYIGPIIRHVLLRRPDDGRLAALKRWPQIVVTAWVLLIVPVLLAQLSLLVYNFPGIARADWTGIQALAASSMASGNPVLGVMSATVQILLLLFPLVGMVLIAFRLLRGLGRLVLRRLRAAGLLTGLAGIWGLSRLAGRPVHAGSPGHREGQGERVPVDSLLESSRDGDGDGDGDGAEPGRARRRLWVVDDDDLPAPRHRARRPGMALPVVGAAAALGVVVILAWTLIPSSSRQGQAADLRPNKVVGAPSTGRPAHPGRTPSAWSHRSSGSSGSSGSTGSSEGGPSSGYPGKGGGYAPSSPPDSYGAGAGDPGASDPGASDPDAGSGEAGESAPGGYGQTAPERPSTGQASAPSAPSVAPAGRSFGGQTPSAPSSSAPSSSAQWTPAATQQSSPAGNSGSPSQAASPSPPQSPSQPPSQSPSSVSPSSGYPSPPGSSSGSPAGSPSGQASSGQAPSEAPPSGSAVPGAARAACSVPVAGAVLTMIGLCPH